MSNDNMFDIAIIGMAGRFPEAQDVTEFWENIKNGKECITFFTDDELRQSGVTEESLKDVSYVKASGIIEDIEMFDAPFFSFTSREAELTDPQQRIFLECAWNAIENAGYVPEKYNGVIGVFGGASFNTYLLNNIAKTDAFNSAGIYPVMIGNGSDFLCTRVSYKLNLKGPSMTIQTACSTSLVAVHMACQSLLNGECDMVLAGGATVRAQQKMGYKYQDGGILSPDGHCRTFDKEARGTVGGNGASVVVLKRLTDAINDRDYIYAVLKGTAINNDGSLKVGFTAPSVDGQVKVIEEALSVADVLPETIDYIEAHGTGTQLGDPIEISALKQVFQKSTQNKNFCAMGSVKANIGHLDAAAGVTGLIKVALMLDKKMFTPNINFESPNPKLDLANSPFYINTKLTEWKSNGGPRRAGVSSFGLGGTNAHVVLEERIMDIQNSQDENSWNIIPISAKTINSLKSVTGKLAKHVKDNPSVGIGNLAYTLATGRREFGNRFYCICKDSDDLINDLTQGSSGRSGQGIIENKEQVIVFLFPEFDVEKVSFMELYNSENLFREGVKQCFEIVSEIFGLSFEDILSANGLQDSNSSKVDLKRIVRFSIQYALSSMFVKLGINPHIFVGGTFGKYIEGCFTGKLSLEAAISNISADVDGLKEMNFISEHKVTYISAESQADFQSIYDDLSSNNEKKYIFITMGSDDLKDAFASETNQYALLSTPAHDNADDSSLLHVLNALGQLWISGISINWATLYKDKSYTHVPLPTYCFDRKKHWIDIPQLTSVEKSVPSFSFIMGNKNLNTSNMDKEYIKTYLKSLWIEMLGVEEVNDDDDFFDLAGDSFMALQVNNEIEKKFMLKLSIKNIIENPSVGKLSDLILSILESNKGNIVFRESPVVSIKTSGSKSPIFLVHPAGGMVMGYKALARYLSGDHPLYGVEYPYSDQDQNHARKIEDIALDYIESIREIQPEGPVILGGHSFGGNVAFEMATRFQEMGQDVEHLIMFDSHPPLSYYCNEVFDESRFFEAFPLIIGMYFDKEIAGDIGTFEIKNLDGVMNYLKLNGLIPREFDDINFSRFYKIWKNNHSSLRTHMPSNSFAGKVAFFKAKIMQPQEVLETLNINFREGMDVKEWSKLSSSGIKVFEVPGNHYTMLNEPNVKVIADVLNKILA